MEEEGRAYWRGSREKLSGKIRGKSCFHDKRHATYDWWILKDRNPDDQTCIVTKYSKLPCHVSGKISIGRDTQKTHGF